MLLPTEAGGVTKKPAKKLRLLLTDRAVNDLLKIEQ
jgi:hypothetical protein